MAFALAAGDIVSPVVYAGFAASSEPPPQGTVTSISPTIVLWQDGRQVQYTPATVGAPPFDSVDLGLSKFVVNVNSSLLNKKVRPLTSGGSLGALYKNFSDIDHRAEGVVVLAGTATNALFPAGVDVAIVRLISNGLYLVLVASELEVIPGA